MVSQVEGHVTSSLPPVPTAAHALHFFITEAVQPFLASVDSHRSTKCIFPRYAVFAVFSCLGFEEKTQSHRGGIFTREINATNSSIQGYPLTTGAFGCVYTMPGSSSGRHTILVSDPCWGRSRSYLQHAASSTPPTCCPRY